MLKLLEIFAKDESGATALEYGLFAGLLAIGLTASVASFGSPIDNIFQTVSVQLDVARDPGAILKVNLP